ncbi:MAG: hypothetical protein JWP89_3398 [Schlesneria sp.]|nr:hypothetical protein [Schlesneria sp.]
MSLGRSLTGINLLSSQAVGRWITAVGIASVIGLINSPCETKGPQKADHQTLHTCSQESCLPGGCRALPGLDVQGKHACASLAVDFNRFNAIAGAAKMAPRVALAPVGAGTFALHSRPTATKVIYLDFDGHVTQNTPWNSTNAVITTTAYDTDGNPATFSSSEQANIVEIWQRISECYSPFDVDVTTEPPAIADLVNGGGGDTKWGIRVLFGDSNPSPAPGSGGVAYVTGFGWNYQGGAVDVPCFVLTAGVGTNPKTNADAAVHEVGHTVGLSHDGLYPASDSRHVEYYLGQGTGKVGWAPHMGAGYYVPIVQWSKGEYANPSNTQDDLSIITTQNGFGYRPDDFSSNQSGSKAVPGTAGATSFAVNVSGVIESRTDEDWFKITAGSGLIKLDAVGGPVNTMLDIQLSLYDSKGVLVVAANPADDVIASINKSVSGGTFYAKIEGVALGDVLTTGYTDYGSLGQYTITGSFSTVGIKGAPVLTTTGDLFYGIKSVPQPINPNIKVADPDNTTLASATITIQTPVPNQDVLSLTANASTMGNIASSYDATSGTLSLTSAGATATVAQFQAALRAVSYSNTSATPAVTPRKINFLVNDSLINSNTLTSNVTIGYYYITAAYNAGTKTLTIADNASIVGDNAVAVTLRGNVISVEGAGATRIGTSASSQQAVTFPYTTDVKVIVNFTTGNDSVSLVSLKSSAVTLNLGDGNDLANLTYCTLGTLTVDGGAGTDVLQLIGTTTTTKVLISVP